MNDEKNPFEFGPKKFRDLMMRHDLESAEQWMLVRSKMPTLKFKSDWEVQIIPPFAGAMVRFVVRKPNGASISVYCDFYEKLGYFGAPYWEAYAFEQGDDHDWPQRFALEETEELLKAIEEA